MKRIKKWSVGLAIALVTAIGFTGATATLASADLVNIKWGPVMPMEDSEGLPTRTVLSRNGVFVLDNGYPAWCLDPAKHTPINRTVQNPEAVQTWTNSQGEPLSAAQMAQLAYVMAVYGGTDAEALSREEAATILFVIRHLAGYDNAELPTSSSYTTVDYVSFMLDDPTSFGTLMTQHYGLYTRAIEMIDAAVANYSLWDGTYTEDVLSGPVLNDGDDFEIRWTLPGIRAGKELIVTLTHPDGSETTHSITTDSNDEALFTFTIPAGASGSYSATAEMTVATTAIAEAVYPMLADPGDNSVQMIVVGTALPAPWRSLAAAEVVPGSEPGTPETTVEVRTGGSVSSANVWLWTCALGVAGIAFAYGAAVKTRRNESVA